MKLDDETLLTAYLDGELDAAGRHRVQAALATSPGLARRLGDLAEARDLVEGLSRPPAPFDFSASVLDQIRRPVAPWAFRVGTARVVAPRWLAVASSLAACLLVAFALTRPPEPQAGPLAQLDPAPPAAPPGPIAPPPPPIRVEVVEADPPTPPEPPAALVASLSPSEAEDEADRIRQQGRIEALLGRRDVRKVTVNVDVIRPEAVAEVRRSIDATPRKDPLSAQLTVTQGVLIDPQAPEGAIVFLVVLDDDERELFYTNLKDRFHDEVSPERPAPTEEVVQLAELGHIRAFDGPPAPHLSTPPTDAQIAIKGRGDRPYPGFEPPGLTLPDALSVPRPGRRPAGGPVARRREKHEADPRGSAASTRRAESPLVLVWLVPKKGPRGI